MRASLSGNGLTETAGQIDCEPAVERASALKPFAKGEVAAFAVARTPVHLDLKFKGPDGKPSGLEAISGRTRLVNLWATWCVPCREEMPALDNLEAELGGNTFEVVAINIDTGDDAKPRAFLEEIKVKRLAYYRDETMGSFSAMKKEGLAFGLPVTVLIDGKGCMLGSMNGPAKWDSEDAKALIRASLT